MIDNCAPVGIASFSVIGPLPSACIAIPVPCTEITLTHLYVTACA